MKFKFPSTESINLASSVLTKDEFKNKISILMILELKYANHNKSFKVVLFENNLPDFLIYSETYERNKSMYQSMLNNNQIYFENIIEEQSYQVEKIKVVKSFFII